MKLLFALSLGLLALAASARADMYPDASNASLPAARENLATAPHLPTNAKLLAAATTAYPSGVWRDDFAAGNGAPPLWYRPSGSPCPLSAGVGDNGSQVQSSDGKCWLAQAIAGDIREWGAVTASSTNKTAVQNAFNWAVANNASVYVPYGVWQIEAQLTATLAGAYTSLAVVGEAPENSTLLFTTGGGILVNRNHAQSGVHFRDLWIKTQGVNTGIGIDVEGGSIHNDSAASSTFDRVKVSGQIIGTNYWATGIRLNGISQVNFNSVDILGDVNGGLSSSHSINLDIESPGPTCDIVRSRDSKATGNNCSYIFNITNSNFAGALYGLKYGSNTQGIAITNTNFTLNWNGIYIPVNAVNQSGLFLTNSQLDNTGDNILIDTGAGSPQMLITNNVFFLVPNTAGIHAIGSPFNSSFTNNVCSTTTGALITAQCIRMGGNLGQTLISGTNCADISACVQIDAGVGGVQVYGTTDDTSASTPFVINNSAKNTNTIRGLIQPNFLANFYPAVTGVTGAANNGSGAVRLALVSASGLVTGEVVFANAPGVTNMPGIFTIAVVDGTHIDLIGAAFAGTYTGGGSVYVLP